ncbi:unnamed protein product, partial [Iphiclides podalirius]
MAMMPEPSPSSISASMRCNPVKRYEHSPASQPLNWGPESTSFTNVLDAGSPKTCTPTTRCPLSSKPRNCLPVNPVCSKVQNKLCSPIRSLSCSFVGKDSCCNDLYKKWSKNEFKNIGCDTEVEDRMAARYVSSSDSQLNKPPNRDTQKSLYCTIEQMCTTVGQLSGQLKELMCRMMEAFEKTCT